MRLPLLRGIALALLLASAATASIQLARVQLARADSLPEVNVYSTRAPALLAPAFKGFTADTGIKVNVVYAQTGLLNRLAAEWQNSPADLFVAPDITTLAAAKDAGIGQAAHSRRLTDAVPSAYRDPDGIWWGLSRWSLAVVASKDRVTLERIGYEDLADAKWHGRICLPADQATDMAALVAAMIVKHGAAAAETWTKGVKLNLAHKPAGDDADQLNSIAAGRCDLALIDSRSLAAALSSAPAETAKGIGPIPIVSVEAPVQGASILGAPVDVSGAVIAKYAPHLANAVKLLEYLTSDDGQRLYAQAGNEAPVKESVTLNSADAGTTDPVPLAAIAEQLEEANGLLDRIGFDAGPSS